MRDILFTTEHTMSSEQRQKLIQDKLERAERQFRARQVKQERTLHP